MAEKKRAVDVGASRSEEDPASAQTDAMETEGGIQGTPARRRVLVLSSTFPRWPGDREPRFVLDLCRELEGSFELRVLAPHAPGAADEERIEGVRIRRFRYFIPRWESLSYDGGIASRLRANPVRGALIPFFLIAEALALWWSLKHEHAEVVHAHWVVPQGLVAVLVRRLAGARPRILCTLHGGDLYTLGRAPFTGLLRWVLRRVDAVTVVSAAMRERVLQLGARAERIEVVPMGTDLERTFAPPAEARRRRARLLFVGRLVEKKGLEYLLQALPRVRELNPDVELLVAGSGPEEPRLRRLCAELGLDARVHFLGSVAHDELAALYQTATLAVFPFVVARSGDQEGFGLVMVEALGCECPVVASDLPAVRDIVSDGITGLLARPGDPVDLAERVGRLLNRPEERQALARRGRREVVQRFGWPEIGARYRALLKELADSGGA